MGIAVSIFSNKVGWRDQTQSNASGHPIILRNHLEAAVNLSGVQVPPLPAANYRSPPSG